VKKNSLGKGGTLLFTVFTKWGGGANVKIGEGGGEGRGEK